MCGDVLRDTARSRAIASFTAESDAAQVEEVVPPSDLVPHAEHSAHAAARRRSAGVLGARNPVDRVELCGKR